MRLADYSVDDNTRQAATVAERIADGAADTAILLPSIATNAGSVVGSPNAVTNGVLIDDDEDDFLQSETSPFEIEDAFEEHNSNFKGKKLKPKQPGTSIAKLPTSKQKPVLTSVPEDFLDANGNEYEYLGQFNGDLSFLDEVYKGVVVKPGAHLYRRNTGVQFAGDEAEYEYSIGDDPESSAIFGKLFKGIGKAIKKFSPGGLAASLGLKAAGNLFKKRKRKVNADVINNISDHLWRRNENILAQQAHPNVTIKSSLSSYSGEVFESNGDHYEYVGQTDGNLSFLDTVYPGMIVPPGAHIYRVQRTESYDGVAEFEYFMGAHPDQAEFLGKAFKAIGKAAKAVGKGVKNAAKFTVKTVGKGIKATGKGIGNAAKWTVKTALPLLTGQAATVDESNGVVAPYNPTAGFDLGGGGDDTDFGDGMYNEQSESSIDNSNVSAEQPYPVLPNETPGKNKLLLYAAIALGVIGLVVYLKKNK